MNKDRTSTEWRPAEPVQWDSSQLVPLEASAGTMILLHGNLVHCSYENTSPKSRHAFTMHVIEGDGTKWAEDNWYVRYYIMCF